MEDVHTAVPTQWEDTSAGAIQDTRGLTKLNVVS